MRVLNGTAHKYRALTFHNAIPREHCTAVVDTFVDEITLGKDSGYWYGSKSYQLNPTVYVTRQMEMEELYPIMGRFVDELLSYPLQETRKTCWCDDTPINILNGYHITQMLEGARLIHVYRDPRDVVASYADPQQNWAPDDLVLSAHWVAQIMDKWREQKQRIDSDQYIEIKYEDLVVEQVRHMKGLSNFVGIEFEEALLDIELVDRSVNRYKDDIPSSDLAEVTRIVQPILDEYDYAS